MGFLEQAKFDDPGEFDRIITIYHKSSESQNPQSGAPRPNETPYERRARLAYRTRRQVEFEAAGKETPFQEVHWDIWHEDIFLDREMYVKDEYGNRMDVISISELGYKQYIRLICEWK